VWNKTSVLNSQPFPLAAVVGLDLAKRALLLLAVEPRLKGALIASGPGTAKSTLARAYPLILPPGRGANPQPPAADHRRMPYVELPLGITEDRLLGSLDLELTLATGRRQLKPGLLNEAHGGVLYVDSFNLLDNSVINHLGCALSDGQVVLEREGLSGVYPADFLLVGTYDPSEGEVPPSLSDRVGLLVTEGPSQSSDARTEILSRVAHYERDPSGFARQYEESTVMLRALIASSRERLPAVQVTAADQRRLMLLAVQLGVEGNRADIFALRAARASAALAGRAQIEEEDLETAVKLVLAPRALVIPTPPTPEDEREAQSSSVAQPPPPAPEDHASEPPNTQHSAPNTQSFEQLLIQALDTPLPQGLLAVPRRFQRGSSVGSRGETLNRSRGRYVKSTPGRPGDGKIAVDATLRAAAPAQVLRRRSGAGKAIIVEPGDLRFKRFKQKAGMLFIFAVDASGSMALNRMNQAKGALGRLLKEAYVHRDKVALLSFRGQQADLLLPPSQSVERAKRSLDALPVGGGTPLAAGLLAALNLAKRARGAGIRQVMLVLFTDGRANVGLKTDAADLFIRRQKIQEELEQVGAALQREAVTSLIVDTQIHFTSRGEGRRLADLLGGRYVYLPRASTAEVSEAVASTAADFRVGIV